MPPTSSPSRTRDRLNRLLEFVEGLDADGRTRQVEILEEARERISREGLAVFSMRRIAEGVGIKLASLQYHFPTRDSLIEALVTRELLNYARLLHDLVADAGDVPSRIFERAVDLMIAEAQDDCRFEFQLWALACHDPPARNALDRYLCLYREFLFILLSAMNPGAPEKSLLARAALIASMIEGSQLMISRGKPRRPELGALPLEMKSAILSLANMS